ncbi:MAG: hypothetical protein GY820_20040 [Gammaproteobacteria bacterium]|nr:hypothetical protein [Gammaproteobacteria bacterium]
MKFFWASPQPSGRFLGPPHTPNVKQGMWDAGGCGGGAIKPTCQPGTPFSEPLHKAFGLSR